MVIAVASGKGGTGKTSLATSLALWLARSGRSVHLADCDVEEPNCRLLVPVVPSEERIVTVPVPQVDLERCDGCGECARLCRYGAIVAVAGEALVFPALCHACGGCALVCPREAIREEPHPVGQVLQGRSGDLTLIEGRMTVGESRAPQVIQAVRRELPPDGLAIIDAPPGAACPVVAALEGADRVIMVTEPTPLGLHDLQVVWELAQALDLPSWVVLNRAGDDDGEVRRFCRGQGLEILLEIPEDRGVAEAYSRGVSPLDSSPALAAGLPRLWEVLA